MTIKLRRQSNTPEYYIWSQMKQRCGNKKHPHYKSYGGRGITVCDRWVDSFQNFLSDMGLRPKDLTLDRKDNDMGYSPENCRWVSRSVQGINRRKFKKASSQYHGVHLGKSNGKPSWNSSFKKDGNVVYVGKFKCELEAANAYNLKVLSLGLERPLNNMEGTEYA